MRIYSGLGSSFHTMAAQGHGKMVSSSTHILDMREHSKFLIKLTECFQCLILSQARNSRCLVGSYRLCLSYQEGLKASRREKKVCPSTFLIKTELGLLSSGGIRRKPRESSELPVGGWGGLPSFPPKPLGCRVERIEQGAHSVMENAARCGCCLSLQTGSQ